VDLSPRFDDALAWASALHRGQRRKGSAVPYVAHVLAVAALVLEDDGDEDAAIAALLHDTIEDCGVSAPEISERFGPAVGGIVEACTDTDVTPKPPWRPRKEQYLAHLAELDPNRDRGALQVSAADKLHNVRSMIEDHALIGDALWPRFSASPKEILWYYDEVDRIVAARLTGSRLPGLLHASVGELRALVSP